MVSKNKRLYLSNFYIHVMLHLGINLFASTVLSTVGHVIAIIFVKTTIIMTLLEPLAGMMLLLQNTLINDVLLIVHDPIKVIVFAIDLSLHLHGKALSSLL